jgi:transposase
MPPGDSTQAGADVGPNLEGDRGRMTMLAETVDAVIGIDTHRDSHEVEIADRTGQPVATMRIGNDSAGFSQLLAAIAELAPGPRVAVCIEGSRSYGIGLARALAAAGLLVIECE